MTRLVRFDAGHVAFFPPGVIDSLLAGGMVVYPTDTLYGMGVDPRSKKGLGRLVAAKSRQGKKPIPLLLDGAERVSDWAEIVPDAASRLMARFWPGALTLVLPAWPEVSSEITGGGKTVGLRVPDHPIPRTLAKAVGGAITGTSANRAGSAGDWQAAEDVVREFTGEVEWVLWDGPSRSPASTVVHVLGEEVLLIREGAVSFRDITTFLPKG